MWESTQTRGMESLMLAARDLPTRRSGIVPLPSGSLPPTAAPSKSAVQP